MYIFQKFEDVEENMIFQCNFQSGLHPFKKASKKKMHKETPMANIMTPVHIVSQKYSYIATFILVRGWIKGYGTVL